MGVESIYFQILSIGKNFMLDSAYVLNWFATPLWLGGITPLGLLSVAGIISYIGVAIAKWFTN